MRITRRELAAALAAPAALARAQAPAPAAVDEELRAARERVRAAAETLAQEDVPIESEPAFQFKP